MISTKNAPLNRFFFGLSGKQNNFTLKNLLISYCFELNIADMKKNILLSVLMLLSVLLKAQNPEFYNTSVSSFNNNFPLNSGSNNKAQWIFGPNQFNAGGTGVGAAAYMGNISKIYVKLGSSVSGASYTNFTISLGQTVGTMSSFGATTPASYTFVSGLTPCFYQASGFSFSGGTPGGWFGIPLQVSFPYNPNLSLVVEIKVSGGVGNNLSITNTAAPRRLYGPYSASAASNATGVLNFGINMIATPLPASVTAFNGVKQGESDLLNWETVSESNNAYFNVQHSKDGIHFKTISPVLTKAIGGNSDQVLRYEYRHLQPEQGHNYYRLQQVDIDGVVSNEASVIDLFRDLDGQVVSIYPNPVQERFYTDIYTASVTKLLVNVVDMQGKVVRQENVISQSGQNHIAIDMHDLQAANYTVEVYANGELLHQQKILRK